MRELVGVALYILMVVAALLMRGSRSELREEAENRDFYEDAEV